MSHECCLIALSISGICLQMQCFPLCPADPLSFCRFGSETNFMSTFCFSKGDVSPTSCDLFSFTKFEFSFVLAFAEMCFFRFVKRGKPCAVVPA